MVIISGWCRVFSLFSCIPIINLYRSYSLSKMAKLEERKEFSSARLTLSEYKANYYGSLVFLSFAQSVLEFYQGSLSSFQRYPQTHVT